MSIPNIRRMFVPDPGYTLFDMDLDSADLRIVTWESDCKQMKSWFAEGLKPYVELGKEYYHDPSFSKKQKAKYTAFKKFCHGSNYLGKASSLAPQCGLLVHECEKLQRWYYQRCPEIKTWQDNFTRQFMSTGKVRNAFGYSTKFFDRREGNIVNEAIAWLPQSTVGLLINHIWERIDALLPQVIILLQVHDSLVGEYPTLECAAHLDSIREVAGKVAVPYPEPLYIPIGLKTSTISWGDCA